MGLTINESFYTILAITIAYSNLGLVLDKTEIYSCHAWEEQDEYYGK